MPPNSQNSNTALSIRNIGSNGVILDGVVDEYLVPAGAVSWSINMHYDRIGSAVLRPGITLLGSQIASGNSVVGLYQALDTGTGTNDRLLASCNTTWYALISNVWTAKRTGLTAGKKTRFTNFVDLVFGVNGTQDMASWDMGSGNFTSTNCASAPAAYYIDNFRSRVWAARTDANPSRLYYSSIASSTYAILWTGSDSSYIDIAPLDGYDLTGIKTFESALYAFKPNAIYKIFSINETNPNPISSIGTYSQESVVVAKDGMYWHHPSGIYKMTGGALQEISRPVYDIIKNIPSSYYDDVSALVDDDHVTFFVGDVTVSGITINKCALRWTISTQLWTVYSHSVSLVVGAQYDNGTSVVRVVGDTDGNVYTYDSGQTDNGSAINYELETKWYNISGLRADTKTIRKLVALSENAEGTHLGWRNGTMQKNEIQPIGSISKQESIFDNQRIRGNRFRFSARGTSAGTPMTFQGFEILDYINEGII